ncbi:MULTISPECIES: hypothetical protein [unclassified Pseudomonas]|jgi:hypothetical protein|uniref:hypothetical protein n=1 Tax=unclassified Pseudomonas TaxID=196821 RepID=UPI0011AB26FD|nr:MULTISPECIES: hypothetical protein [unclassified Pseudomonas]
MSTSYSSDKIIFAAQPGEERIKINPIGISQNTDTHIIGITEDKLHRILKEHHQSILKSRDWIVPLGILLTTSTTLYTSTFKDFLISGASWNNLFVGGTAISAYLTVTSVIQRWRNSPMSVKELVDTIAGRKPLNID